MGYTPTSKLNLPLMELGSRDKCIPGRRITISTGYGTREVLRPSAGVVTNSIPLQMIALRANSTPNYEEETAHIWNVLSEMGTVIPIYTPYVELSDNRILENYPARLPPILNHLPQAPNRLQPQPYEGLLRNQPWWMHQLNTPTNRQLNEHNNLKDTYLCNLVWWKVLNLMVCL
ncbi:14484_t:CDS:2 [Dentiscutata erythropus]|uniref:14484_t:CDS:1 n=1 Tax=Dentiscutata erythropus TaxID=1348616 RepID=A0A9N9CB44_9GLOM|nr:14484_t:CDS:2 [Dentiscutata erythropus]